MWVLKAPPPGWQALLLSVQEAQWPAVLRIPIKHCLWVKLKHNGLYVAAAVTATALVFYCIYTKETVIHFLDKIVKWEMYVRSFSYWVFFFFFYCTTKCFSLKFKVTSEKAERGALLLVMRFLVCAILTFYIQINYFKYELNTWYDWTFKKGIWFTPPGLLGLL